MKTSINPAELPARRHRRHLIGSASNFLLLGFLAGVYAGFSMAPAVMTWLARLTLAGLAVSVMITFGRAILARRAARRIAMLRIAELERRMERLIPRRRVFTHGTHPKNPPNYEDTEHDWLPVARRGRKIRLRK